MNADGSPQGKRGARSPTVRSSPPMWMRRNGFHHPPQTRAIPPLSVLEDTPPRANDTTPRLDGRGVESFSPSLEVLSVSPRLRVSPAVQRSDGAPDDDGAPAPFILPVRVSPSQPHRGHQRRCT